jgi:cell division septation protein DedD
VDPEAPQDKTEDEFSHEKSLDHRELAVVQGNGLKYERADEEDPSQQPEGVAKEIDDEPPTFGVRGVADAGDVLSHYVQRIGQCGQQREEATHAANARRKTMRFVPVPAGTDRSQRTNIHATKRLDATSATTIPQRVPPLRGGVGISILTGAKCNRQGLVRVTGGLSSPVKVTGCGISERHIRACRHR